MTSDTRLTLLCGVFGFLQLSMMDVGLLGKHGELLKKKSKMVPSEQDGIAIYEWVSFQLIKFPVGELRKKASVTDGYVKKLLNEHQVVNNFLLSLLLLREYLDEQGSKAEQILMLGKITRLIDVVDEAVSDDDFDVTIKKTTWRTADNIYRQFAGKAQLTDEIRDLKAKRFLR